MSAESRLKHKLNRKIKLKTIKFMGITNENKQARDVVGSVTLCEKETGEKRNSKKYVSKIISGKANGEKVLAEDNNMLRQKIYVGRNSNLKRKMQTYGTTTSKPSSLKGKHAVDSTQTSKERRTTNMNVVQSGSSKPLTKRKTTLGRCQDIYQQKQPDLPRTKKQVSVKKKEDDKPKKKKRVIRLDPCDISNKRLDDGILTNGEEICLDVLTGQKDTTRPFENMVVTNVDFVKKNEMSKNAQFRAIQPSSSVLSFVEDNLLGRRRSIELQKAGYNTDFSAPLDNIPFSTSKERERIEENIFRNKLTFFAAAKVSSSFPPFQLPEVAFAGRSNVGKSSLLNALTRQWGVVRTSDKPGLTQTINFFNLGPRLNLVDLPGYGFAYAKEEVKDSWEELVKEYVSTRICLKRVCLLVDTKWGMKPRDHELIDLMERSQTKYQIVLTKTDVVFPSDVARRAMQIEENLRRNKSLVEPVMMVSSKSGAGIRSLRTVLAKISRFAKI